MINEATDPILRRVQELCALLANRTELESTGNGEMSTLGRDNTSAGLSCNSHDNLVSIKFRASQYNPL